MIPSRKVWMGVLLAGGIVWGNAWQSAAAVDGVTSSVPSGGIPAPKVTRYAQWLLERHDANHDGVLQPDEWKSLAAKPEKFDRNADQRLSVDELCEYLLAYARSRGSVAPALPRNLAPPSDPATAVPNSRRTMKFYVPPERLPAGLPEWFLSRDSDGDAQLTKNEFAPAGSSVDLRDFERLDLNRDGMLTPQEAVGIGPKAKPTPPATSGTGTPAAKP